jgi:putative membrane protein
MASTPSLPSIMLAWSFEPSVVLGLVIAAATYVAGLYELARRGRPWRTVTHRHAVSFMLGLLAVLLALLSPIDTFAGRLFALHMLQHLLLLMVAPPLLLGKPLPVLLVGAPRGLVQRIARAQPRDMMYVTAAALLFFAMLARDERDQAMEDRAEQVASPVDV